MKNQYFGDVRDYLKYSLLTILGCELSVAVCWLLTPDDSSPGGRKTGYLSDLKTLANNRTTTSINAFLRRKVIHRCRFCAYRCRSNGA